MCLAIITMCIASGIEKLRQVHCPKTEGKELNE
jgi:hypothetical protein